MRSAENNAAMTSQETRDSMGRAGTFAGSASGVTPSKRPLSGALSGFFFFDFGATDEGYLIAALNSRASYSGATSEGMAVSLPTIRSTSGGTVPHWLTNASAAA